MTCWHFCKSYTECCRDINCGKYIGKTQRKACEKAHKNIWLVISCNMLSYTKWQLRYPLLQCFRDPEEHCTVPCLSDIYYAYTKVSLFLYNMHCLHYICIIPHRLLLDRA